jgi:putative effector of murein hydrolase
MKKRNLYLSLTIMCALFSIAFTFDSNQINWLWKESEPVGILLMVMSVVFAIQLYKQQKRLKEQS